MYTRASTPRPVSDQEYSIPGDLEDTMNTSRLIEREMSLWKGVVDWKMREKERDRLCTGLSSHGDRGEWCIDKIKNNRKGIQ